MRRYWLSGMIVGCGLLTLIVGSAHAQQAGGSAIRGRVVDPQQGVLPGVAIVAIWRVGRSGRPQPARTEPVSSQGSFPDLPDHRQAPGLRRFTQDVRLQIGETATIDLTLEDRNARRIRDRDGRGAARRLHVDAGQRDVSAS